MDKIKEVIWKFPLGRGSEATIEMPVGFAVMTVGVIDDEIYVWAGGQLTEEKENRYFRIMATGEEYSEEDPLYYVGTAFLFDGKLVFHVFMK